MTWIVDISDHNGLAHLGAVEELVIEGPLVGRGYLGDPEKTADAFFQDPPWLPLERHGCLLYKTGDLVRYRPNGSIDYVGRKDTQVKVRGQRIELGEVEHYLLHCLPQGVEIVAKVIEPNERAAMLVAFLCLPADEVKKHVGRLATQLDALIPGYMIPSAYVAIEKMPITLSGKTDRKLLKKAGASLSPEQMIVDSSGLGAEERDEKPTTPVQSKLQGLWAQVLNIGIASISLNCSFFVLGGDSILAMKLVAAAREEGLLLTVADIFQKPRLGDLARAGIAVKGVVELEAIPPFSLLPPHTEDAVRQAAAACCQVDEKSIEDIYPCTSLQEGLIALTARQNGAYVGRNVLKLPETTDLKRFQTAWETVVANNSILRTRIVHTSSGSVQVVLKRAEGIQWLYATNVSEYLECDRSMHMTPGSSLARWAIISPTNGVPSFIWTVHHALYDGWTFPMIADQFHQAYYEQPLQREVGYNIFIKYLSMQDHDEGRVFWQAQLAGARNSSVFPILPTKFHEPLPKASAECQIAIPSNSQLGITLSCIIRAAWSVLVARLINADDIVFGATLVGRNAPILGVERVTGPTITTVPVRVKIDPEQNSIDFLANMQKQAANMMSYEHVGLQNISRLGEDPKAACGFQTLLVIQPRDEAMTEEDVGQMEVMERLFDSLDALDMGGKLDSFNSYPLMLVFNQKKNCVCVQVSFDETVIPSASVYRLLGQIQRIMQQLCVAAEDLPRKVGDIDCMSERDLQDIWHWNATVPKSARRCIHDLISERALQQPSAKAVCAHDGDVTYQELEDLSTKLGQHLVKLGVGRQDLVALCFEKSIWTTISMLGVLKAGGAFVAMDMTQPEQRLRAIVLQAEAKLVLTSAEKVELSGRLGAPTIMVDAANIAKLDGPRVSGKVTPTNVTISSSSASLLEPSSTAFVVFTSGTTGIPKEVIISHENFCSASEYHVKDLGFHSEYRVFDFASYSFDVAIDNALTTLINGGCLCVPHDKERKDGIEDTMERMKVNVVNLTPSVAKLLDPLAVPSLKVLILAGEAADAEVAARWSSRVHLINAYGPAECQTCTVGTRITKPEDTASIGRGSGSVTWIVDPINYNRLLPVGAVGELLVEGPIVSEGYLKDAERTEAAFLHNPIWLVEGFKNQLGRRGRLYKTGDLVRYGSDGTGVIEYLGRKDRQVKMRGQRVELGEIEYQAKHALSKSVTEVAAEVIELNGAQILLGFVCLPDRQTLSRGVQTACHEANDKDNPVSRLNLILAGIEEKLSRVLPAYMIPTAFVLVDKMPITVTGKTDRKLLREMALSLRDQWISSRSSEFRENRELSTSMEFTLRGLWAQVLGVDAVSIGADEDFFRRGGDSITAMKLAAAARSLGLPLKVPDVFQYPYLSKMAAMMESQKVTVGASCMPEFIVPFSLLGATFDKEVVRKKAALLCGVADPALVEDVYPCTPMQEGLMALTTNHPASYVNRSIIKLSPHTDIVRLRKA